MSKDVTVSRFYLNEPAREWLKSVEKRCLEFSFSDNYEKRMFNCFLHNARSVRNKTKETNALLQINEIDIGICVESWIRNNMDDNFFLQKCWPFGFKFHSAPRLNKRGRGICLFYRSNIQRILKVNYQSSSNAAAQP